MQHELTYLLCLVQTNNKQIASKAKKKRPCTSDSSCWTCAANTMTQQWLSYLPALAITIYFLWCFLNFIKMLYTGFIDLYRCYSCFILDYFLRAIFHYVFYALAISRSHTGTTPLHTWISGAGSLHLGRPSQCQHLHRWGTVPFSHGSSRQQSFGVSKSLHINYWIFTNTKNIRRLWCIWMILEIGKQWSKYVMYIPLKGAKMQQGCRLYIWHSTSTVRAGAAGVCMSTSWGAAWGRKFAQDQTIFCRPGSTERCGLGDPPSWHLPVLSAKPVPHQRDRVQLPRWVESFPPDLPALGQLFPAKPGQRVLRCFENLRSSCVTRFIKSEWFMELTSLLVPSPDICWLWPSSQRTQSKCLDAAAHHNGVRPSGPGWFLFAPAWTKSCITCKCPVSAATPRGDGISLSTDLDTNEHSKIKTGAALSFGMCWHVSAKAKGAQNWKRPNVSKPIWEIFERTLVQYFTSSFSKLAWAWIEALTAAWAPINAAWNRGVLCRLSTWFTFARSSRRWCKTSQCPWSLESNAVKHKQPSWNRYTTNEQNA